MSIELVSILLFGGLLLFLSLGVPVVFAIGGISVILTFLLEGYPGLYTVATTTYREITDPTLITIPLFLLMGNLLIHSGISDRLFKALGYWLSGLKGSLAIVSVGVCVALAMCGGFGPGILTMGLIAVPAMLKHSYNKSLALGSVMAGGVLGTIIPPSIIMIVFSFIARVSIGRLFFGGALPGFICAFFYIIYIATRCYFQPHLAPKISGDVTWKMRLTSLKDVILPFFLIVVVLGSIFLGIATPTEAAGVGAMGALIICVILNRFTWKVVFDSSLNSLRISGMALWILISATLFGIFYTTAGAQSLVMDIVEDLEVNRWLILVGMQIILIIFGMFMDDYAVVTICAPIFLPIAKFLGFNPIWFSIVFLLNMQVAYLTPPFGWALILMKGVAPPEITTGDIWRSVPPFVVIQLIVLILTMIFSQLALWLPGRMF
ncbi:MAG TPA: TRAP transporter large permease subunit [Desulfobacteraceae bacterium]|nr:TRAP transporter large permease subunit [Deltaproteobacteria bacterium]HDH87916.1 TRAP transporter large permease subunit [Desulfobacteraceae bacterium]